MESNMKYRYMDRVLVKEHPSLNSFYGAGVVFSVVNFRPVVDGQRFYVIQPLGGPAKYRVGENNLELFSQPNE